MSKSLDEHVLTSCKNRKLVLKDTGENSDELTPRSAMLTIGQYHPCYLTKILPDVLRDSYGVPLKMVGYLRHGSVWNSHYQRSQVGLYISKAAGLHLMNGP